MATPPDLLRKLAYSAIIVGGCLALGEMVLAPWAPPPPEVTAEGTQDGTMAPSAHLGWAPVPGETRAFGVPEPSFINEAGTRNPPFAPEPEGIKRLLTLGDSTVFGVLVRDEEVFGAVAARALSEALGHPVEAINGGVPGYSSEQARRLYEAELQGLGQDWVVIATLWSDAQDAGAPDTLLYFDRTDPLRSLLARSATFRLLESRLRGARDAREVAWELQPGQGSYRVGPARYRENLVALAALARADGAEPVFLQLPSDRDLREEALERPRPTYREIMAEVARDEGALLVDGASPFRGGSPALMADDVHPTAEGHALLGRALAKGILAGGGSP